MAHLDESIGDRDVPTIFRRVLDSGCLGCRRVLPVLLILSTIECYRYLDGQQPQYWLTAPHWLILLGLRLCRFLGIVSVVKKPRRGPLDKWVSFAFGAVFVGRWFRCGIAPIGLAGSQPAD